MEKTQLRTAALGATGLQITRVRLLEDTTSLELDETDVAAIEGRARR